MSEQGESNQEAQFALQRIYLKDASFESPKAPHSFRGDWQPKINLELNVKNNHLEGDLYEVVLTLTQSRQPQRLNRKTIPITWWRSSRLASF